MFYKFFDQTQCLQNFLTFKVKVIVTEIGELDETSSQKLQTQLATAVLLTIASRLFGLWNIRTPAHRLSNSQTADNSTIASSSASWVTRKLLSLNFLI